MVAGGDTHSLALTGTNHYVYTWGNQSGGQTGRAYVGSADQPTPILVFNTGPTVDQTPENQGNVLMAVKSGATRDDVTLDFRDVAPPPVQFGFWQIYLDYSKASLGTLDWGPIPLRTNAWTDVGLIRECSRADVLERLAPAAVLVDCSPALVPRALQDVLSGPQGPAGLVADAQDRAPRERGLPAKGGWSPRAFADIARALDDSPAGIEQRDTRARRASIARSAVNPRFQEPVSFHRDPVDERPGDASERGLRAPVPAGVHLSGASPGIDVHEPRARRALHRGSEQPRVAPAGASVKPDGQVKHDGTPADTRRRREICPPELDSPLDTGRRLEHDDPQGKLPRRIAGTGFRGRHHLADP